MAPILNNAGRAFDKINLLEDGHRLHVRPNCNGEGKGPLVGRPQSGIIFRIIVIGVRLIVLKILEFSRLIASLTAYLLGFLTILTAYLKISLIESLVSSKDYIGLEMFFDIVTVQWEAHIVEFL